MVERAGGLLFCLIDGLGHGSQAARAAELGCQYVVEHADDSPGVLLLGMSFALSGSRGAVATIVWADEATAHLTFAGVGNVNLRAAGPHAVHFVTTAGVLGRGPVRPRVSSHPLGPDTVFVLHTDGLSSRFDLAPYRQMAPQAAADAMIADHASPRDDAACVVFRLRAEGP